jgi:predicted enzyme involved in methoxymalonyl-ACP biosynthesis
MGRKLENVIMSSIVGYYSGKAEKLVGIFVPTKKNVPVIKKYDELGFTVVSEDESGKTYSYDISKGYEKVESYSEIIFNGEKK